jgi:primary-amine oxidase
MLDMSIENKQRPDESTRSRFLAGSRFSFRMGPLMNRRIRLPLGLFAFSGLAIGLLVRSPRVAASEPPNAPNPTLVSVQKLAQHPLDPLSPEEILTAVEVVRDSEKVGKNVFFPYIVRNEPPKSVVTQHKPGDAFPREAFVVLLDRPAGRTFEAVVDLRAKKILSFDERKGVQPPILVEEYTHAAEIVRADKRWQEAMRKRGLKDEHFKDVALDTWAAGFVPGRKGQRLIRTIANHRGESANHYSRVIEGVIALVDMTEEKVVEVLDPETIPIPTESFDYFDPRKIGPLREKLRPLQFKQPQGADFVLQGNEVRWQKWSLRHSIHPREGLVLHSVTYDDGGKPRSILHRASLSEMLVPYGDPSGAWRWRNAFDVGEYGLGVSLTPMRAGHEVPESATLLPVVLADDLGKPVVIENGMAIYEQDGGLLWTHTDFQSKKVETRRARQLVLHTLYTVGNYDYSLRWIFGQDGSIEVQVELTGMLLVKGVKENECVVCQEEPDEDGRLRPRGADRYGTLVAPGLVATHHQHFFNFRLDFDLEGVPNTVYEMELVPEEPVPSNPERNAFVLNQRQLRTEREAQRDLDHRSHRAWKVLNPNRQTALGHFPAYELVAGTNSIPFAHPESTVRKRGGFTGHHLWVTRYKPGELYAAGDYPNQSAGGDGLPRYGDDNESLLNADVVLWYTMGLSHASRVEEWPVMPVSRAGFRLVPHNFFDRNPALDVR